MARKPARVQPENPVDALGHVVVCAGSLSEWARFTGDDWSRRIAALEAGVRTSGAGWLTLIPYSGEANQIEAVHTVLKAMDGVDAVAGTATRLVLATEPATLVIDLEPDGQRRFVAAVEAVSSGDLDEDALGRAVLHPVPIEPDLVVIFGPPDRLPPSLMWELGYSELVFLSLGWDDLDASHLEMAVEDFHRRSRRFGGLDS